MEFDEARSVEHSAQIVSILKTMGVDVGSHVFTWQGYSFDLSVTGTNPFSVMYEIVRQSYESGLKDGDANRAAVVKLALGITTPQR